MALLERRLIERHLGTSDFAALERLLAEADLDALAKLWPGFPPLRKLLLFKLMDAPRALDFYGRLGFDDRYFLLCGFPMQSIAPILEALSPLQRRHFVALPRAFYDRMLRGLARP